MATCQSCGVSNPPVAASCANCGRPLVDGGFTRVLTARKLGRQVEQTQHFEIHAPAGSFAGDRVADVGARLEALAAALAAALAVPDSALGHSRVNLADVLPDPQQPDHATMAGSWIVPERDEVWSIYRPDAPGIELERQVLRLLVLRATGADLDGLPLLWNGIVGLCAQQMGEAPAAALVDQALLTQSGGKPPAISQLWRMAGGPEAQQLNQIVALSFAAYLLGRAGPAGLRAFVETAAHGTREEAAREVFGCSSAELERAWLKAVQRASKSTGGGGIGRFLRGSMQYLRPYWKQELVIFLCLAVQLAFQQFLPKAQELLIDKAILQRNPAYLLGLTLVLLGLVVLMLLTGVVNDLTTTKVSESVMRTLRERMFGQLQRLTHRFYSATNSGDILSRFTSDLRSVEQGLTSTLTQGAFLIFSLIFSVIHIFLIDWILGALVLVTLPLFLTSTRLLGPPASRASLAFSQQQAETTNVLQENLAAQAVIKAFNLQPAMMERFSRQAEALYRSAVRLFFLSSLFGVTANLLTTLVQVGILTLGGYFVIQGHLQLGSLIEFLALLGLVIGPVQNITGILQSIQIATASMDRVDEILNQEPDVRDAAEPSVMLPLRQSIRFEGVSFSYRGDKPQLQNVSLEIAAGQSVAFVGPSGSGKSTIINLLMRFYDPNSGRVLFDGSDISGLRLDSVRDQIGIVFQENFLFNTTIRENIRTGRLDASDAEVEAAAKQAEIHDVIQQMPQGYDTVVGERGGNLSGGQRQRLAIARAILRQPSILILDEATSALDPRTENAINHTLAALGKGRTTVAVTHRLAAAQTADRIFVLDAGRLVQQGTHAELVEQDGLYRRLYEEQGGSVGGAGGQLALEVAYLRSVPVLASLSVEALRQIASLLHPDQAVAGEEVVRAGTEGDRLYLIVSGELEVLVPGIAGQERKVATLGAGDYFGEIALLRDVPRIATVRALTSAQFLSLTKEALAALLEGVPGLRRQLDAVVEAREAQALALDASTISEDGHEQAAGGETQQRSVVLRARQRATIELYSAADGGASRTYPLNDDETGIGRNRGNDIVLTDRLVSGFHARIRRRPDGRYVLLDSQSRNGTLVNGQQAAAPVLLQDGDTIQVGGEILRFHAPAPVAQPAATPSLEATDGPQAGQIWPLSAQATDIGRNPANDIVVTDPRVSGRHARVERRPDGSYLLLDRHSANGTLLNGRRLAEQAELHNGDRIALGGVSFVFHTNEG